MITPKEIIDAYINANRALFLNQKTMYDDIEAAKILGIGTGDMAQQMVRGIGKKGYGRLNTGIFTPLAISKNVMRGFYENAIKLQKVDPTYRSPIFDAMAAIAQIRAQLFRIDLDDIEGFPLITNPLATSIMPDLVSAVTNQLAPLNTTGTAGTAGFVGYQNVNIDPATQLTRSETAYLDPLEKMYVAGKRRKQKPLTRNLTRAHG